MTTTELYFQHRIDALWHRYTQVTPVAIRLNRLAFEMQRINHYLAKGEL